MVVKTFRQKLSHKLQISKESKSFAFLGVGKHWKLFADF